MINKKVKMLVIQLITPCFLLFFLSLSHAEITLTVGNGSGFVGSDCCNPDYPSNNKIDVSLDNSGENEEVMVVNMDVCDVDDYLFCRACETTERTSSFTCRTNEIDGCCRVFLLSLSGDIIEEGTGPIFTLLYDVSEDAEECRDIEAENVVITDVNQHVFDVTTVSGEFCFSPCTSNEDCADTLFCNGTDSCNSGTCVSSGDPCPPGTVCDEETDSCITTTTTSIAPTTTTTAPINTTTIPNTSTSTTIIQSSCEVSISPLSTTLKSGTALQFSARTECGGEEVAGSYNWQIVLDSTIGSTIDGDGLFTAGDNTTDSDIDETIRVTDTAHGNKSATATVTIKVRKDPVGCETAISPLAATVSPGDTLTLMASVIGDCDTPLYEWDLTTETDSLFEPQGDTGIYTAGENESRKPITDTVTVTDTVNGIDAESVITITNIKRGPCPTREIYGENAEEVVFLRNFRDEVLSKSPSGEELIRLYYEWGPTIVKAMEEDEEYRREIKEVVDGVLKLIRGRRPHGNRYGDRGR